MWILNLLATSGDEDVRVLPHLRYMELREDVEHAIYSGPCTTLVDGHLPQDVATCFEKAGVKVDVKVRKFVVPEEEESEHSDDWKTPPNSPRIKKIVR